MLDRCRSGPMDPGRGPSSPGQDDAMDGWTEKESESETVSYAGRMQGKGKEERRVPLRARTEANRPTRTQDPEPWPRSEPTPPPAASPAASIPACLLLLYLIRASLEPKPSRGFPRPMANSSHPVRGTQKTSACDFSFHKLATPLWMWLYRLLASLISQPLVNSNFTSSSLGGHLTHCPI